MAVIRKATWLVAALVALAAAPVEPGHAGSLPVADVAIAGAGLVVGVDPGMDLAEAQPVQFAARLVRPGQDPDKCSFVPSKNPLKPKRNACRFV